MYQGSSARLVLPTILGELRAWREIQNLYMRFVILKVRNPLQCTVSRGPLYVIVRSPGSWDWPTWLNKPCYGQTSFHAYSLYWIQQYLMAIFYGESRLVLTVLLLHFYFDIFIATFLHTWHLPMLWMMRALQMMATTMIKDMRMHWTGWFKR